MMSFLLALATPFIFVGLMVAGLFNHPQQPPVEQSIGVAPRTLVESQGGTGTSTYVVGDILYSNATNQLTGRNIGSANQVLTVSGGVPTWAASQGASPDWVLRNGAITPSTTVGILVNASSSIGSSLNVSGNLNASSTFFVSGLSNLTGGFISNASSSVGAGLQVAGALNASSSLFVANGITEAVTPGTFNSGKFNVDSLGNITTSGTLTQITAANPILRINTNSNSQIGRIDFYNNNGSNYAGIYAHDGTGEIRFGAYASNYFPSFYSNGTEASRIDTAGTFIHNFTNGTFNKGRFSIDSTGAVSASGSLMLNSAQDTNVIIQRAGVNMVYLGDSGSADAGDLLLYSNTGAINTFLRGGAGFNSYFNNGANLGVMTQTPVYTLDVAGTMHVNTNAFVSSSLFVATSVNVGTTGTTALGLNVQGNGMFSGNVTTSIFDATGTLRTEQNLVVKSTNATSTISTGGLTVGSTHLRVESQNGNVTMSKALSLNTATELINASYYTPLMINDVTGNGSIYISNNFAFDGYRGAGINMALSLPAYPAIALQYVSPSAFNNQTGQGYGMYMSVSAAAASNVGANFSSITNSGAHVATMEGFRGFSISSGAGGITDNSMNFVSGGQITGGSITNHYDFRTENFSGGAGPITNRYGVYISHDKVADQSTLSYGIYQTQANVWNYFGGNVGINSTTPSTTLSVGGSAEIDGTAILNNISSTGTIIFASSTVGRFTVSTTGQVFMTNLQVPVGSDFVMCQDTAGVNASQITSQATNCTISLRATKQDIFPLDEALAETMELEPISYLFRKEYSSNRNREVGLIAEDVEKVDPRLVSYDKDGKLRTVFYDRMGVLAIAAIQELKVMNDNIINKVADVWDKVIMLDKKYAKQQKQIDKLEARINALEHKK